MKPIARLGAIVAGLVLLASIAPSSGAPPNPTGSDSDFNTAGGAGAFESVANAESPTRPSAIGRSASTPAETGT